MDDGNAHGTGRRRFLDGVGRHLRALISTVVVTIVATVGATLLSPFATEILDPGDAAATTPSAYCVVRGLGPYESDALVLAIDWRNTRGEPVLVRRSYLILGKGDTRDPLAESSPLDEYKFRLVGSYPTLNPTDFVFPYNRQTSFILEPDSMSPQVLIFRPEHYEEADDRKHGDFRFEGGQEWQVFAGYERVKRGVGKEHIPRDNPFTLRIPPTVDALRKGADCRDLKG